MAASSSRVGALVGRTDTSSIVVIVLLSLFRPGSVLLVPLRAGRGAVPTGDARAA
jgi:hypothetical protein